MASYQIRQRERLFDSSTQEVIEKRGRELIGLGLIAVAVLLALILGSYGPNDPSWFAATDAPVQNLLGRFGATLAGPLYIIVGWGGWTIPLLFGVWGLRFVRHRGAGRAPARIIFAPIFVALAAIYASTHVPGAGWTHSFGLGGLFGDTVLGAVLSMLPVQAAFGLKVLSFVFAIAMLATGLFVLGCTRDEIRVFGGFLSRGAVLIYSGLLGLGGLGVARASQAAAQAAEKRELKRQVAEASAAAETVPVAEPRGAVRPYGQEPPLTASYPAAAAAAPRSEPPLVARPPAATAPMPEFEPHPVAEETAAAGGLKQRLAGLMRRTEPEPEPWTMEEPALAPDADASPDDRIRARIADVIKNRARTRPVAAAPMPELPAEPRLRPEPPVARRRGPAPMVLPKGVPQAMDGPASFNEIEVPLGVASAAPAPAAAVPGQTGGYMPEPTGYEPEPAASTAAPLSPAPGYAHEPASHAPGGELRRVVQTAPRKPSAPSRRAQAEAQPSLAFEEQVPAYDPPPLSLLENADAIERHHLSDEALEENARMLENVLDDYGVKGEIVTVRPGPVVTMYELEPAPGLKASRVIGLADDIARSMSALSARVSTVPGRSVIGIELPNDHREKVLLREILSTRDFGDSNLRLPLALGKDIAGDPIVANLAKMPHLLIAGTTGSGKSVAINTMILSLLYKLTPDECRLIMIDPKMLELSVYDGIPHLLSPVVTDPKKAVVALKWVVGEMEDRYRKMSKMGVRNIEGYNGRVRDALDKAEMFSRTVQTGFDENTGEPIFETEEFAPELLPYIVVIVDEMADLMMVAGKEIEACIQRLAQMARASGIHLIMATQRPSVDVITGTIKANFPTRISFQVTSKIDSRTILGEQGAEQLLGMGDMLYMAGGAKITRVHGPFVSDEEVEEIVTHLKSFGPPEYIGGVVDGPDDEKESDIDLVLGLGGNTDGEDALYDQAVQIVIKDRKCSTSYIQRKLAIGYNKAARLVEQMEDEGLVSASNHVGKREILVPEQG